MVAYHSEELYGHEPIQIMRRDQRCQRKEQGLHRNRKRELIVHALDVVYQTGYLTSDNQLCLQNTCTWDCRFTYLARHQ